MQPTYCKRYGFGFGHAVDPITEDEARRLDASGELYTVLLGSEARPDAIIEVNRGQKFVGVTFVDEHARKRVSYGFWHADDKRMFLEEATIWQYPDDDPDAYQAEVIETIVYRPDRTAKQTVKDKKAGEIRTTDARDVPVESNWEPIPAFGEWTSVAREER